MSKAINKNDGSQNIRFYSNLRPFFDLKALFKLLVILFIMRNVDDINTPYDNHFKEKTLIIIDY